MNRIVKIKFGSHLYGTNTPDSDIDYKGIFMPELKDILLNRVPKSLNLSTNKRHEKNKSDDIDTEIYSFHYFIELACKGETVALDMLHAPINMIEHTSELWNKIVTNRERFYTRNLKAFVGYARRQASKYGIKGSRLNDAKRVLDFFADCTLKDDNIRLVDVWDILPTGEHIFKHEAIPENNNLRMYEVCGRKLIETIKIAYALPTIQKFYQNYGHRAELAAQNKGIDWKAVSHALRAAFQVKEILTENTITFPLKEAPYLLDVKKGKLDYQSNVAPQLDSLMDEVEQLSIKSELPMKVNRSYWDDFIYQEIGRYYDI